MSQTINIVQITGALGVNISAKFIAEELKVPPLATEGRAVLWDANAYHTICDSLVNYVQAARAVNPLAISGARPKKAKDGEAPAAPTPVAAPAAAPASNSGAMGGFFGDEPAAAPAPAADPFAMFDAAPAPAPATSDNGSFF